ncbi:putative bifunctional diguanylate cyclase/phosphodiesterase [Asticcacaulis sp. 201]|uniref:putative bifunctional diguanylate cyclase/phosphodiesterase n=1 Tax=Asticcacaulis sp. 201 TaxID=3028787 RepID=UPI002915D8A1|nr:EAL domain-containing protein [Asticcacaulis sp. 201]MDV6332981.1 EAL domain-containing protein [Asticcacaulis sp. 201]
MPSAITFLSRLLTPKRWLHQKHISRAEAIGLSQAEEVAAMKPIVSSFCLIIGIYYSVVTANRFLTETGAALWLMFTLSAATVLISFYFHFIYLKRAQKVYQLNVASLAVNLFLFTNPVAFQALHYDPKRLVYFIFLTLMFAMTGISLRVIIPSIVVTLVTVATMALTHQGFLSFENSAMTAVMIPTAVILAMVVRQTLFRAVESRVRAENLRAEAQSMADSDVLTGLPNRRSFFRVIETALRRVSEGEASFHLALIDLDGFKPINDIYGHSVGDTLLIEVGSRLRQVCGEQAFVARMGGDEFAIILNGDVDKAALDTFGRQVCDALRDTYFLGSVTANISGSVGFVCCDSAQLTASQLLERADYALYFAKQNLRGAPVVFTEKHEAEMRDFSQVDQALRSSDLEAELSIMFQPQVDVVENRTISFEALARWNSAKLGSVRPDIFIKAAERSGLITEITLLLLEKSLTVVRGWPEGTRVSFNLSARDLRSGISIANICNTVRQSGIDPRRIEFEITETAMLTDFEQACEALARLKAMGCRIAVDDFGSGYSSFSYIHRLPVDKIKIDRSFVVQLLQHGSALKIIKTIIDLCRNLNLDCVIEGVETQAEMNKLAQVRARYIQGYLFSKPLPAEQVIPYLMTEAARIESALKAG